MTDPRQLRNCLGHFATGVTVVTLEHDGNPHGATVNAFAAVSLDPPLVLVSLDHSTKACRFLGDTVFTVNVLRREQDDLALLFSGRPTRAEVRWAPRNGTLAPRLLNTLAYLACTPWRSYDGGDHTLFLGKVEEFAYFGGEPLLFYRGRFGRIGPTPEDTPWIGSLDNPETGWLLPMPAKLTTARGVEP
jgi:flavin reductase (DIM6/NTAB) family NADH-FMN oxidoreductase RutF